MGQYFKAVVLAPDSNDLKIVGSFDPMYYGNGVKQMEHAWQRNHFVEMVESFFSDKGLFYKNRLVWAGDYAENEPDTNYNLYELTEGRHLPYVQKKLGKSYRYVINHSKRQYVDKTLIPSNKKGWQIHPLPLLTAEGNEGAGGEYLSCYPDHHLLGLWARDIISIEEKVPAGYEEIRPRFVEKI